MTFDRINRRTHLYLGLFLLPWFLVYAVSSLPFSHRDLFQKWFDNGAPQWTVILDRHCRLPAPADGDLRSIGAQLLAEAGLEGAYGVGRPQPGRINVYRFDFWSTDRLTYFVNQERLLVEKRRFRWDHFLTGLHARGGFQQNSLLHDAWAVVVDVVCVAMLVWVASGIYMWWQIRRLRFWGGVTLCAGIGSFALLLWTL